MNTEQWEGTTTLTSGVRIIFMATHCGVCRCVGVVPHTEHQVSRSWDEQVVEYRRRPPTLYANVAKAGYASSHICNLCVEDEHKNVKSEVGW